MSKMKTKQYVELETEYGANNYAPLDVVITEGEGVWVEQAQKLTLTSRAFRNDQLGHFYKELCELTNSHKVLLMNSGAEAVETAITLNTVGFMVKPIQGEAGGTRSYVKKLAQKGLLCKETHTYAIRFAPPLIITKKEVGWALKIIEEVLISC